jgi:three-Cys-motif partner protein
MNLSDEFFLDLKEWSRRKLSIIEKYIGGFSNILGSRHNEIYYVDGFAGKGVYDKGEKGSPVLAAEISEFMRTGGKPCTLFCINVEKDPDNYSNLCIATNRFGKYVKNYEGSFDENIDTILFQVKSKPTVFFIDDFGVKGTDWDAVEKVIVRQDSTDVWIRFDHKTVRRLYGFFDSDAKDARGKLNTLQNLFGITDLDYLRKRLGSGDTAEERIENAVNLYIEQLEITFAKFGKNGFAAAYPIISIGGQRKYHLVFACAHRKAATLANNIVNGIEETFQREKGEYQENQTGQMNLFSSEVTEKHIFAEKVRKLKASVILLPKNRPLSRENLHYELLVRYKNWFGKIGGRHLTQALKELLAENPPKITCLGTPGKDDSVISILE